MLDHIIVTVSDVERSLKFYTAALKPLKIKMFMPYKGADGHPDLWGFGDGQKAFFWLKQGQPDPASIHWGFRRKGQYLASCSSGILSRLLRRGRVWSRLLHVWSGSQELVSASAAIILKITKGERTEEFDAIVWTLKISKRFLFSDLRVLWARLSRSEGI